MAREDLITTNAKDKTLGQPTSQILRRALNAYDDLIAIELTAGLLLETIVYHIDTCSKSCCQT